MTPPPRNNPLRHLRASDLRGVAQLGTQAAAGATRIAEGVHQAVLSTLGVAGGDTPGQTSGMTGLVYRGIQGATQLLGKGADTLLARLQPVLESADRARPGTPQREAILAALNGVLGDRLAASGNPFATPMDLRYQGKPLDWRNPTPLAQATGKVLLLIHGLCMNDLQWQTQPGTGAGGNETGSAPTTGHGEALARTLGYTPVYLRYNSGLHTSQSGRALAMQLEQLVANWPTPAAELTVLAHSMGGLMIRSALYYARQQGLRWPDRLKNIVFLGTPHHGAPLERAGNWVDVLLGSTPYSAPFAGLARLRSAGITDLRYGHVLDQDWQGHDRFRRRPDSRTPVPLPEGVACYAIAATLAAKRSPMAERLVGDGLVPLHSALGHHDDPQRSLVFAKSACWIGYRMGHLDLLHSPEVTRRILDWLTPAQARPSTARLVPTRPGP